MKKLEAQGQSASINFVITNKNLGELESVYQWAKQNKIFMDFWPVNFHPELHININGEREGNNDDTARPDCRRRARENRKACVMDGRKSKMSGRGARGNPGMHRGASHRVLVSRFSSLMRHESIERRNACANDRHTPAYTAHCAAFQRRATQSAHCRDMPSGCGEKASSGVHGGAGARMRHHKCFGTYNHAHIASRRRPDDRRGCAQGATR